jgi:hypothetical protein
MDTQSRRERFLPYPELVEVRTLAGCRPYTILDSRALSQSEMSGAVDKVARVMSVPLDAEGRPISIHELGHVRYSGLIPATVNFEPRVLAAVEDARVNLALRARGVPVDLGEIGDLHIGWLLARDAKHGDTFALFLRSVASIGTSVEPLLCAQLERLRDPEAELALEATHFVRMALEKARVDSGGEAAPDRRAISVARVLARRLRALGLLDARGFARSTYVLDCCVGHITVPDAPDRVASGPGARGAEVAELEAGQLRIARARLTRRIAHARGLRAWRASTEGSVVRYTHRWVIDRAIFRRRGAQSRGTVLVDVSSSMSLADEDLERLLAGTGQGMRVAIYSGQGGEGELRIVAEGGRRAEGEELARFGSGNVVDLPALRWLARQPRPRLWISDGKVTGINDQSSPKIREQARAICRRAVIRRVDGVAEAAKLLGPRRG